MTEQEYKEQRAYWVNAALSLDRTHFKRCVRARLREIAKLDTKHDNRDFEEIKQELYNDFGL